MNNKFRSCILALMLLLVWLSGPQEASSANFIQKLDNGQIDWTNRIIEATGSSSYIKMSGNEPQARSIAKCQAIEAARDNLLSILKSLPLDSGKSVGDFLVNDRRRSEALLPYLKKAEAADIWFGSEGKVKVTLSLRFDGELGELLIPDYIKTIEPITQVVSPNGKVTEAYSGILIDCRAIGFKPCMIPRIVNERKEEIFGPAYVSRECVVRDGMVKYVAGTDSRVKELWLGSRPLVLKAFKVLEGMPTIVVLTNADAELIRSEPSNLELFHHCKVVFLLK